MVPAAVPVLANGSMLGGKLDSPKVSTPGVAARAPGIRTNGSAAAPATKARREVTKLILPLLGYDRGPCVSRALSARRVVDPGSRCAHPGRSEEHTSELQSLMRISYAVFCLKKKKN